MANPEPSSRVGEDFPDRPTENTPGGTSRDLDDRQLADMARRFGLRTRDDAGEPGRSPSGGGRPRSTDAWRTWAAGALRTTGSVFGASSRALRRAADKVGGEDDTIE